MKKAKSGIDGELTAVGTYGSPIYFASYRDDSVAVTPMVRAAALVKKETGLVGVPFRQR